MIKLIKDVKVEVWKRYYYEVDKEDSLNDIEGTINNIYLDNIICKNEEFLFDTEEPLSINDNDDQATVEIFLDGFEDSFNKIFNNVDEEINHKIIDEKVLQMAAENNLEVLTWTVNDPEEAKRLDRLGVAGITTDRPGWLKEQMGN